MSSLISTIFGVAADLFNRVPVLNKLKGYRSVLGFVGLGVVAFLQTQGIGSPELLSTLQAGFLTFTGLALNAKANS